MQKNSHAFAKVHLPSHNYRILYLTAGILSRGRSDKVECAYNLLQYTCLFFFHMCFVIKLTGTQYSNVKNVMDIFGSASFSQICREKKSVL